MVLFSPRYYTTLLIPGSVKFNNSAIQCRKKHSYVCPTYEATGSCPQGSKCKLHHPKNRTKAKRSKQLRDKKNGQGRYFRSAIVPEPGITVTSGKCPVHDNSYILFEGNTADYISLDFNEEAEKTSNLVDEEMYISDGDPMDFQLDGLDDLIKPIRIMNCWWLHNVCFSGTCEEKTHSCLVQKSACKR